VLFHVFQCAPLAIALAVWTSKNYITALLNVRPEVPIPENGRALVALDFDISKHIVEDSVGLLADELLLSAIRAFVSLLFLPVGCALKAKELRAPNAISHVLNQVMANQAKEVFVNFSHYLTFFQFWE
jgi:hypothetical protein